MGHIAVATEPGHLVIDASAGTGKTHWIVQRVRHLLTAPEPIGLEQILLVTYTEKAAGELKHRLREELTRAVDEEQAPAARAAFQRALDQISQANVFTIHGFCKRVLEDYAFENGHDFRTELVDDGELLEVCLREIQRTQWPMHHGVHLARLLELSGYGGLRWEQRVLGLARVYRPACGHRLRPAVVGEMAQTLRDLEALARTTWQSARSRSGEVDRGSVQTHPWWSGFSGLNFRADHRTPRRDNVLRPLLGWLADPEAGDRPLSAFIRLLDQCRHASSFDNYGFELLHAALSDKAQQELPALCPGLAETVQALEALRGRAGDAALPHHLAVQTVLDLHARLDSYKRERGFQSFEDMLARLNATLAGPRGDVLANILRGRFHCAIVDEFQDTDPLQWRILQRIFLDAGDHHALCVVGDRKQAIFAFRGADVHTYEAATRALTENYGGDTRHLVTNYRSCPELLQALNHLFGQGGWFDDFTEVHCAKPEHRKCQFTDDEQDRAALTLVDLSDSEKLSGARRVMARFIAREIHRILALDGQAGPAWRIHRQGETTERLLRADDICILVATRKEADPVVAELQRMQIPFTFYKQTGLWQSAEAAHLLQVMRALAKPQDAAGFHAALLTRFFRLAPADLARADDLTADYSARSLFLEWCGLAEQRRWAELFQSLLVDSGLVFHESERDDGDRRLTNFRHIFQSLEQSAYGQDLDLLAMVELVETKRRHGSDDDDLQPIETERPKVKIMTIHASKGLEFPIVFLAGGFTGRRHSEWLAYHEDGERVFDLRVHDAEAKTKHDAEDHGEDRRLYYVALTRAMFKLYVPCLAVGGKGTKPGPVATILLDALVKSQVESLGRPIAEKVPATMPQAKKPPGLKPGVRDPKPSRAMTEDLFPPIDEQLSRRSIWMQSFSSLHRSAYRSEGPHYGEPSTLAEEEPGAEVVAVETTTFRGTAFGQMVHDLIETLDFDLVGEADGPKHFAGLAAVALDAAVDAHWAKMPDSIRNDPTLRPDCREEVARLAWHGLHAHLAPIAAPLWTVPRKHRLHEVEFLFPQESAAAAPGESFLTGFMDLLFMKNGRYYLVDWKTNVLPGYSLAEVARSVQDCDYVLQYRIYLQALERWLTASVGPQFDFLRDFGGVFYLYLRGMNGIDDKAGVYFHRPNRDDLRSL